MLIEIDFGLKFEKPSVQAT